MSRAPLLTLIDEAVPSEVVRELLDPRALAVAGALALIGMLLALRRLRKRDDESGGR